MELRTLTVAAVCLLTLVGCGKADPRVSASPTPVTSAVTIAGREMAFDPSTVVFVVGRPVTVTFSNVGGIEHDLLVSMPATSLRVISGAAQVPVDVPAGAVHLRASAGQSETVALTPTAPGTYHFECTLPGHAAAGMVGTFVVVAGGASS